jgi:hypothetical protein
MFLFDFFRSFLPLHNPIGFGAADFVELALALLLVALTILRVEASPFVLKIATRTGLCMLALGALPVVLRLALLSHAPVPIPAGSDDFSYWLLADTLHHFRLANPMHPMREFFEAVFILQEPSYSSIFPLGQSIVMAAGWLLFGYPWAGVLLSAGALCALVYWMLRAWTTPGWAVTGGLLAVMQFGVLSYWVNTYWGGAVSACAGCLVFGALPRLRECAKPLDGVALGAGLGFELLTRPFEFAVMLLAVVAYFALHRHWKFPWRTIALAFLPAASLLLLQNYSVTGSWLTMPYQLSRYQYGVPTTFTFQPNPTPHHALTQEQELDYRAQSAVHDGPGFATRFVERLGFYRFFLLPPLYLALPLFVLCLRERRFAWLAATIALFAIADNFYPYFYPHYVAALACLFLAAALAALEGLYNWSPFAARVLLLLCGAHFIFWYGIHALGNENVRLAMAPYESWDYLNEGDPEGRIAIERQLAATPGKLLVFVHYSSIHSFHEWIHNAADIDSQRIVRALDRGGEEDEKLHEYYPDRTILFLEADARPPRLLAAPAR